jgi:hypothetical protein
MIPPRSALISLFGDFPKAMRRSAPRVASMTLGYKPSASVIWYAQTKRAAEAALVSRPRS